MVHPFINKLLRGDLTNLSQSFYETVMPPADVYWIDGNIQVKVDLAGFDGKDIDVCLEGPFLRVEATRNSTEDNMKSKNKNIKYTLNHRPLKIDARIPLPINPFDEKHKKVEISDNPSFVNGVLTLDIINFPKKMTCSPNAPKKSSGF